MNAEELYRAGQLAEAIESQTAEVKANPADIPRRSFLCELLCLAGNLERADAQLETIDRMSPEDSPGLALMRQLIRAEKTRHEVHREGRVPEFLKEAPKHIQLRIEAAVALRAGEPAEATRLAMEAEEERPSASGKCNGEAFADLRDLDDFTAGIFEVLTSTGRYMWIPTEDVISVEFDAPTRPLDLLWRPADMSIQGGPDGKVFLPAVYCHDLEGIDDLARLGRRTDWVPAGEDGAVRGIGLCTYLVGEEARGILEISTLALDEPGA